MSVPAIIEVLWSAPAEQSIPFQTDNGGKFMKKFMSLLLVLMMVLSLAACGGNSGGSSSGVALRTSCENLAHNLQKRKSV
jgi:hypothetical protein